MFGIGMPEMILILAVALIVIGPKKLPDLAKSLGRALGEFKKATREFKETMEIDSELTDVKKAFDEMNQNVKGSIDLKTSSQKSSKPETQPAVGAHHDGKSDADSDQKNISAFDNIDPQDKTAPELDTGAQENSPAASAEADETQHSDESKGLSKDAS